MRATPSGVAEKESRLSRVPKQYQSVVLFLRDAGMAVAFVALVLLVMFAYTGLWPPLVVVESNSMMHGDDNTSHIGTIDTGDLVLVKKVDSAADVQTYVDGFVSGHRTYGDYGDVIVYKRSGSSAGTPIIHRAIIYLELNSNGLSYSAPSLRLLPDDKWSTANPTDTWDRLTSVLSIKHVGYNDLTVSVDIPSLLTSHHGGFITKGDHNYATDQTYTRDGPVEVTWVVGKARGEIPWFGLLKLWSTGTLGSPAPENSVRNLWISLALIVITPIGVDVFVTFREKGRIAARRAPRGETGVGGTEEEKKAEAEDLGKVTKPPKLN
jgi:signal peptidase